MLVEQVVETDDVELLDAVLVRVLVRHLGVEQHEPPSP
jgi:hypothetical protein